MDCGDPHRDSPGLNTARTRGSPCLIEDARFNLGMKLLSLTASSRVHMLDGNKLAQALRPRVPVRGELYPNV
jgi:hypothetical protein